MLLSPLGSALLPPYMTDQLDTHREGNMSGRMTELRRGGLAELPDLAGLIGLVPRVGGCDRVAWPLPCRQRSFHAF